LPARQAGDTTPCDWQPHPMRNVVRRVSTGKTVRVAINAATYPKDVRSQMKKIESVDVTDNPGCVWPELPCKDLGKRKDNEFRNVPEAR